MNGHDETEIPSAAADAGIPSSKQEHGADFIRSTDPFEVRSAKTLVWSNVSMTLVSWRYICVQCELGVQLIASVAHGRILKKKHNHIM